MHEEFDFSRALKELKDGKKLCRQGWNGKGICIYLVDEARGLKRVGYNGEMCDVNIKAHIVIDSTGLQSDNDKSPKTVVPWLASQTDLLAEDWRLFI